MRGLFRTIRERTAVMAAMIAAMMTAIMAPSMPVLADEVPEVVAVFPAAGAEDSGDTDSRAERLLAGYLLESGTRTAGGSYTVYGERTEDGGRTGFPYISYSPEQERLYFMYDSADANASLASGLVYDFGKADFSWYTSVLCQGGTAYYAFAPLDRASCTEDTTLSYQYAGAASDANAAAWYQALSDLSNEALHRSVTSWAQLVGKSGTVTIRDLGFTSLDPAAEQVDVTPALFADVPAGSWYYDAVLWAGQNGITAGTSATTFSPDQPCTRAQMAVFLYRMAGSPSVEGSLPFEDVPADAWYHDAVLWAVQQGITVGTGDHTYSPDAPCTRAQMATFLWRRMGSPEGEGQLRFADVPEDAWYRTPVLWAAQTGITAGTGDTTFSPDAPCTRAQMVTFLYRLSRIL